MPNEMMNQEPPPGEAPAAAPEGGGGDNSANLKGLIIGIHNNMLKFKELIAPEQGIADEAKAKLDSLISEYRDFVVGLGKNVQQPQAPQAEAPAEAPPQAPAPGPQKGRMPMSGGKGAVPAL